MVNRVSGGREAPALPTDFKPFPQRTRRFAEDAERGDPPISLRTACGASHFAGCLALDCGISELGGSGPFPFIAYNCASNSIGKGNACDALPPWCWFLR